MRCFLCQHHTTLTYLCTHCIATLPWLENTCIYCGNVQHQPPCTPNNIKIFNALLYDGYLKKIIKEIKYHHKTYLIPMTSHLLWQQLNKNPYFINQCKQCTLITYVPCHIKKKRQRGFDLPQQLAISLGKRLRLPVKNIFERTKNTQALAPYDISERHHILKDVFKIKYTPKGSIILIDDIITTGATLEHITQCIPKTPCVFLALARAH